MKKSKRILAALICVVMVTAFVPAFSVSAATYSGTCGDDLTWTLDSDGVLTISGTGAMNDYSSTSQPWESSMENITSVVIEDGVTSIGNSAFFLAYSIVSVTIPEGVTSIGRLAFAYCAALPSITLPVSLTSIGSGAFHSCLGLTNVYYSGSQENWANISIASDNSYLTNAYIDYGSSSGTTEIVGNGTCGTNLTWTLGSNGVLTISGTGNMTEYTNSKNVPWYSYLTSIKSVKINTNVTSIGQNAFNGCSNLASVTIPNGITSLGWHAFRECSSLKEISIPDSVTSIGYFAFCNCSSLTTITLSSSLKSIGRVAFSGCSALESVYISDLETWCSISYTDSSSNPMYYADNLYINNVLATDIVIPSSITEIKDYAFYGCNSLTSVIIPNSMTSIGDSAFYSCNSLTSVTIYGGVTNIAANAFQNCSALENVYISDLEAWCNITFENSYSNPMYYADNLYVNNTLAENIVIPSGITEIKPYAFYGCGYITSITIPNSLISIGKNAFSGCVALTTVYYTGSDDIAIESGNLYFEAAYGVSGTYGDNLSWTLKERILTISGTGQMGEMDNYSYISLNGSPWYNYRTTILSVIIESGVTRIGMGAFSDCTGLTTVTIPDSVIGIGIYAFYNCSSLTEITIPDSVTIIADSAFSGCSSLTEIIIPNSVTTIEDSAFYNCSSLTEITIPGSVTTIGNTAFSSCTSLKSIIVDENNGVYCDVDGILFNKTLTELIRYPEGKNAEGYTIPDTVTNICDYAFCGCDSLTNMTIPGSVNNIGECAFSDCDGLTEITIPDSVTSIGDYVFAGCDNLISAKIGNGVKAIGTYAFNSCDNLTNVTIGENVTTIGYAAFESCAGLESVVIPNSVTSIGDDAFYRCTSLANITIPDSMTSIGYSAFASTAYSKNSSNWEDNVLYIGNHLIEANTSIAGDYEVKDGTITMASGAFRYCSSLTSVTIPDSVITVGEASFFYCSALENVNIGDNVENIGIDAFGADTKLNITVSPGNSYYSSIDGVLFNKDQTEILAFAKGAICPEYTIPEGVVSIADEAFFYSHYLTNITIPKGVTNIGSRAFYYCTELADCEISSTVTNIDQGAFFACHALEKVIIPDSVTNIGGSAFEDCYSLASVTIGDGVTSIGDYAFQECLNLESVIIGNNVESIGYCAFDCCWDLTDVYYTGSEEEWNDILMGEYNDELLAATIHYNYIAPIEVSLSAVGKYEGAAEAEVVVAEDGSVGVNVTISDESVLSAENVKAYAVSYSGGVVENVDKLEKTVTDDGATFSGSVSGSYKIFIWDENMQPITEAAE